MKKSSVSRSFFSFVLVLVSSVSWAQAADPVGTPAGGGTNDSGKISPDEMGAIHDLAIPKGASVSFANLKDGQKVKANTDLTVKFAVKGMKLKPAGDVTPESGHHHLLIDVPAGEKGLVVPNDEHHIHFGKAQTEGVIKLTPGKHTLTLQFANASHMAYGPQLTKTISVIAE